jgi:hypothetical protein
MDAKRDSSPHGGDKLVTVDELFSQLFGNELAEAVDDIDIQAEGSLGVEEVVFEINGPIRSCFFRIRSLSLGVAILMQIVVVVLWLLLK